MYIDRKFFERIVQMLEAEHNVIVKLQHEMGISEPWIAHVDATLAQCKEINLEEEVRDRNKSIAEWQQSIPEYLGGEEIYRMALDGLERSLLESYLDAEEILSEDDDV